MSMCILPLDRPSTNLLWRMACIGVLFIALFLLHMIYLLTKERIRKLLLFAYIITLFFSFLFLKSNIFLTKYIDYYYGVHLYMPGHFYLLFFVWWIIVVSYAHFLLIKFFIKQKVSERRNLSYLFFSIIFGFISGTFNFLYPFNFPLFQFGNFGVALYCLIFTYAIFKHQMLGIEILYRKGLFYSFLVTILMAIYLVLIMIAEWLFRGIVGYKSLFISFSSAFIIAILFNPLRNKLQSIIDRIFLGKTSQEISKENELLRHELERSERLKATSTLALGLAHEVKNPLTTIKTFAEYLPEKYKDEDFVNKFSKIIPTEVERINNIVHHLLDFSKPSAPIFIETNIHELLKNILAFLNSNFLKNKIKVNEFYADSVLSIKADPIQLKQAFLNIFLNSIEAMPTGGNLTIKTGKNQGGILEVSISDTGYGIPKKNLTHVFDPFFSTKDSGTGLGLSIAYQIIKNHNGSIKVESIVNKGTTFQINLPLEK